MVKDITVVSRGVLEEDGSERDIVTVHESKKFKFRIQEGQELLPGIPNDLIFDQVVPKLPWIAFHTLSCVSRGWQRAIQTGRVYDARVRSKSMQTLVAMNADEHYRKFLLYSVKDGSCYHLPPIPGLQRIPQDCECVSLDGKLYVLGGFKDGTIRASASVFLLDLAGQTQWKQCASMAVPRAEFGCDVFDGKIYVFGGTAKPLPGCGLDVCLPVSGSEVYDPKADAWSPITSMTSFRSNHRATTVGEEIFIYDGLVYAPDFLEWAENQVIDPHDFSLYDRLDEVYSAEVYSPLKDEWRTLENFISNPLEAFVLLMVGGEPHMVNSLGLHVYDSQANSWTLSQSFSFDVIGQRDLYRVSPSAAVAVDDVLLVDVLWRSWPGCEDVGGGRMISQGLGEENKEMVFQKAQCPSSQFLCLIQL